MVDRKVQTSFRLTEEEDSRYKALAEERGITFNQLVRDCLAAAYTNPNFINPIKPLTESEELQQRINKNFKSSFDPLMKDMSEVFNRLDRLEANQNSIMEKFEVEQPVKDKSGRRIFDD